MINLHSPYSHLSWNTTSIVSLESPQCSHHFSCNESIRRGGSRKVYGRKYTKINNFSAEFHFRRIERRWLHAKTSKTKLATPGIEPGSERRCSRYGWTT